MSHNQMSTFFSGTDIATLKEEGIDNNHFVSLIVNNSGVYNAAITRKINDTIKGNKIINYNSFNDEHIQEESENFERTDSYVEYYPLNVIMPSEDDSLKELEERFKEVKEDSSKKQAQKYTKYINSSGYQYDYSKYKNPYTPTNEFKNAPPVVKQETPVKQLSLFTREEMGVPSKYEELIDIPYGTVHVRPSIIADTVTQIITGDIFSTYKQTVDIDKWAANMENLYNRRFQSSENENFKYWVDTVLDFLVAEVDDPALIENGEDYMWAIWAYDVIERLESFPQNRYLKTFINSLNRWII